MSDPTSLFTYAAIAIGLGLAPVQAQTIPIKTSRGGYAAHGPGYEARWEAGGFRFAPAASPHAEIALHPVAVLRGGVPVAVLADSNAPRSEGLRVVTAHGLGIDERYDLRKDGIELSLVFPHPMAGQGDLVARYEVETELEPAFIGESIEGLAWLSSEGASVGIGAVTGIDATGATARGSLRYDGRHLDLVLPASFVESASYPIVLDPLIGAQFTIQPPNPLDPASGYTPDLAYDAGADLFVAVWRQSGASSGQQIKAQRMTENGVAVGSALTIASGVPSTAIPRVANVALPGKFLIVWQHSDGIRCRALKASDGTLSNTLTLSTDVSASGTAAPDVGGESTLADDDALVVWRNSSGDIAAAQVSLTPATPGAFTAIKLLDPPVLGNISSPRISKTGGTTGRLCVTYVAQTVVFPSPSHPYIGAQLVDRNLNLLGASVYLSSGDTLDEREPEVDGNGTNFVVAYRKQKGLSSYFDVYARSLKVVSSALQTDSPETKLSGASAVDGLFPAVAFCGPKAFVAWSEWQPSFMLALYGRGIGPGGCITCESTFALGLNVPQISNLVPAIASEPAGSPDNDRLMCAWQTNTSGATLSIVGRAFEAWGAGATGTNVGGACGSGGTISASGTLALGYPSFQLQLTGADPAATIAILNESFGASMPITCGTCAWDNYGLAWFHFPSAGNASRTFKIPCDASLLGAQTRFQWTVYPSAQSPCPLSVNTSLSDRLEFTFVQ